MAKDDRKKYSDHEIIAKLCAMTQDSINVDSKEISDVRTEVDARYHGQWKGKIRGKDYSQHNTMEVYETVEELHADIMNSLVSRSTILNFDAIAGDPEDETKAEFESKVVNFLMLRANEGRGFIEIGKFVKDALKYQNAYGICDAVEKSEYEFVTMDEVTDVKLFEIASDKDNKIMEAIKQEDPKQVPLEDGSIEEVDIYTVKYMKVNKRLVYTLMCIPPEQSVVGADATTTDVSDINITGYWSDETYSDLRKLGYSAKLLDSITARNNVTGFDDNEKIQRMYYVKQDETGEQVHDTKEFNKADRKFRVYRYWVRLDIDNDGIAELRKIVVAGDKILEKDYANFCRMFSMSSIINPHTHVGSSPAIAVKNIEAMRTSMSRMLYDSVYDAENRKTFMNYGGLLPGNLTSRAMYNRRSRYVYTQGMPREQIWESQAQPLTQHIMPILEQLERGIYIRTGIIDKAQLNPGNMQNVKTGAAEGALDKSTNRVETLVRTIAETGIRQIASITHRLCRIHPELVRSVKMGTKWIDADADTWPERNTLTANIGLGIPNRDKVLARLERIMPVLQEAGQSYGISDVMNAYNVLHKYIEESNVLSPDMALIEPVQTNQRYKPPQEKPDPREIIAQATAQEIQSKIKEREEKLRQNQIKMAQEEQGRVNDFKLKLEELRLAAEKQDVDIKKEITEIDQILDGQLLAVAAFLKDLQEVPADGNASTARDSALKLIDYKPAGSG